jgi:hypothetical protein
MTEDRFWVLRNSDGQPNFVSHELEGVTICAEPRYTDLRDWLPAWCGELPYYALTGNKAPA